MVNTYNWKINALDAKISGWIGSKGAGSECRITRRL